jgi:anti-anti-sigma factor
MLRIDIQTMYPNVTLRCTGRLVLGLEAETLRCMATSRHEPCVTLDLRGIHTLDAAGLGLLVELQCWAQHQKKSLRIAEPSACVRRLIALTNLHSVLPIGSCQEKEPVDIETRDHASLAPAERAMSA